MTKRKKLKKSDAQILLGKHLRELGLTELRYEFRFSGLRQWTCDIAAPSEHLLFECDGGIWSGGHKRGKALEDDYLKQNTAQLEGWRILRFSNEQIESGAAKEFLKQWVF